MTQSIADAKSFHEILEIAIGRELRAQQNYHRLSELVNEKGLKNKLVFLANEEDSHRVHLVELFEKLSGTTAPAPVTQESAPAEKHVPASLKDILSAAMKKEQESHDFYRSAMEKAAEPHLKVIFEHLAHEEDIHRQMLSLELQVLEERESGSPLETVPWHMKDLW